MQYSDFACGAEESLNIILVDFTDKSNLFVMMWP